MRRAAAFAAATAAVVAAVPAWMWTIPIDMPFADQVVAYTAQGLRNRNASAVWYLQPVFWSDPNSTLWFAQNYLPGKGFVFTNVTGDFCDLAAATGMLASAGGPVRGIALYNETALDASRWLAVTASALNDLLPLNPAMLGQAQYACLRTLPIVADFSQPLARWTTNVAAYQWGVSQLLPHCANGSVYSAGHSFNDSTESVYLGNDPSIDLGLDGAVAQRMFVFNLSPDTVHYPAHAAQFTAIVAALRAHNPALVPSLFGWAEPEPEMTYSTSVGGGAVVCDAAPNLSFWSHVGSGAVALPYNVRPSLTLQDHVYVAFQTNEGDTPKILAALQGGLWLNPARGSIPMSWGIDPLTAQFAPALLEFYAATATANDTFFAATAGAGYTYPWLLPPVSFNAYVDRMAGLVNSLTPGWPAHSWEVDIWDWNSPSNVTQYAARAGDAVGMVSMQPESMAGTNTWLPMPDGGDPLPLIIGNHSLWYPLQYSCPPDPDAFYVGTIADTVASIRSSRPGGGGPVFTVVYGIVPTDGCGRTMYDYARMVQSAMGAGGVFPGTGGNPITVPPVHVVGMQDMVRLARQYGAMGGRGR